MEKWTRNAVETELFYPPATSTANDRSTQQTLPLGGWPVALDLVLWRHAEAEPAAAEGDLERMLTRKGRRQAERMAAWLDRHLPESTRVLVSPSRRTLETAQSLGRNFKPRAELGPLATDEDVLDLLRWRSAEGPKYKGSVLVVGHRASLAPLAARLLGMPSGNLNFRKGAVIWLRSRTMDGGAVRTSVVASLSPDLLGGT